MNFSGTPEEAITMLADEVSKLQTQNVATRLFLIATLNLLDAREGKQLGSTAAELTRSLLKLDKMDDNVREAIADFLPSGKSAEVVNFPRD